MKPSNDGGERRREQWLHEKEVNAKANPRRSRPPSELERGLIDEPLATDALEGEGNSARVSVRVTSVRKRLLDEDNLCEKYHVDCCRYSGILPSDDPGKTSIKATQRKAQKGEEEFVMIEITQ